MPQKRNKGLCKSKSRNKIKSPGIKNKKKNVITHRFNTNLITQSVGDLPFRNKCIQKNLILQKSHKSISKFETSVGFNEEKRPNG